MIFKVRFLYLFSVYVLSGTRMLTSSELEEGNYVVEAYPGYGKTKLGVDLLLETGKGVFVTRTHQEIEEVLRFSDNTIRPIYGKEKLCPIWRRGEDISIYRYCRRMRILQACRYKYRADSKFIAWLAVETRKPDEIRERAKKTGVCPYPSILTLFRRLKLVATTYGFAFTFWGDILQRRPTFFDEAHTMLDVLVSMVECINDAFINTLFRSLKQSLETRPLAYAIRAAWRKAKTFPEFIDMLDRMAGDSEIIDSLIMAYYNGQVYWRGKWGWWALKPRLPEYGALFLTAYLPPFLVKSIPNLKIIKVEGEQVLEAYIDTDLTSKYEERNEETYRGYAKKIEEYYLPDKANLAVFPSYEFMDKVLSMLSERIASKVRPAESIRDAKPGDIVVDVAGGVATEGVNPTPHLGRVIVAGLPYPKPDPTLNVYANIYGFDAVYTYLALLRVVQALGRLRFRGDAVLIDRRYKNVVDLFPPYIKPV